MTRFKLRFSKHAVQDIADVLGYTLTQFGEQKFREYQELIRKALTDIAANPDLAQAKHRPELHVDARTFHIARPGKRARHFFIYRVKGEFIDIARLLHDSMDLRRHLPDDIDPVDS